VSANLIFPINYHSDIPNLEKKNQLRQRDVNFLCMHSSLLEFAIVTEFQAPEAYSNLIMTKTKYNISRRSLVEKENVIVRINPSNFRTLRAKETRQIVMLTGSKSNNWR
jgi:hypothetical protein